MSSEFVVAFSDQGRDLKIDLNNGYVYDQGGNQVAKWDPKDSTTEEHEVQQLCADYVHNEHRVSMRGAYESSFSQDRIAHLLKSGGDFKVTKDSDVMRSLGGASERAVLMGLGVGDVHLPAAMPNFAGGYRQFKPMADMASPPLLTTKPADKYFIFDKNDAFQQAAPTVGSQGGAPNEIPARLNNQTFSTTEYALGGFVPLQLDAAADAPLRIRQATLKRILNVLMLRREIRVATLLETSANWNSGNVATLGAGFQWDGGASSDPIKDLQTRMEQSLGDITGIIMAEPVWHAFQRNPAVQKYFTYKAGVAPLPNEANMASILELPPIYVARMKYFAPNGGALTFVWGNHVVMVRQPEQMPPTTQDDIATSYTFRWNAALGGLPDQVKQGAPGFGVSGAFVCREFYNQLRGSLGGSQLVCAHFDAEEMTSGYVGGLLLNAFQ